MKSPVSLVHMYSVWTYPWTLYQEGLPNTIRDLADRGVDAINLASHYHSIRALQPRFPEKLFTEYPAGCYFSPEPDRFDRTPIDPLPNEVPGADDAVLETVEAASEHGIDVHAWTVCFHNTRLGAAHPDYRIQSAFGDAHDHAFCPSHPEVREYYASLVEALDVRGVAEIQLESLYYPSAFHDHGVQHGHDKGQLDMTPTERTLLSQCFCAACRSEARKRDIDIESAKKRVREILSETLRDPTADPVSLDTLIAEDPDLHALFRFRGDVITDLTEQMAERTTHARLSCYVNELDSKSSWAVGLSLTDLDDVLDRMLALCYVSDPHEACDRIRTLRRTVSCPVDAGITIDPNLIDSRNQFLTLVDEIANENVEQIAIYNHGFMTETHLEWLADALA